MSRRIDTSGRITLSEEQSSARQGGKLLFTVCHGQKAALLIQDDRLTAARFFPKVQSKIGAVYIGKVKHAAKNLNAWFVEIGGSEREICFLSQRDAVRPFLLNRTYDGRILEGDEFPVQVVRDAAGSKQAAVTTKISLADQFGNDSARHVEELYQTALHRTCFSCLMEAPAFWEAALEQLVQPNEYEEILTDDRALYEQLLAARSVPAGKTIRFYDEGQSARLSLANLYGLESKLDTALNRRVWLKSGGYLVIDPTEALTVIDVNSGKCETGRAAEETYRRINMEAAEEIARQLRLRNLSGMIVVDFINMKSAETCEELLDLLKALTKQDRQKTTVVDMTALGLVEITRKKGNKPLKEQLEK